MEPLSWNNLERCLQTEAEAKNSSMMVSGDPDKASLRMGIGIKNRGTAWIGLKAQHSL